MKKILFTILALLLLASPVQAKRYGDAEFVGTVELPNSTSLPATCTVGEVYIDTDATTKARLYSCESTDTWVVVGASGGGTGDLLADGTVPLTANWDAGDGSYNITASGFIAQGTSASTFNASKGATSDFVIHGDTVDAIFFADVSANDLYSEGNKLDLGDVTEDYVLTFNATTGVWAGEAVPAAGAETNSLETTITGIADTELLVGNGADSGVFVVMSGDATLANTGAITIGNDKIDSQHYVAGSIDLEHMSSASVDSDNIVDATIVTGDIHATAGITLAQTAITAGRSLTISTNDILADAELYTDTISFAIETPADSDAFLIWKAPMALTITDIDCITGAATSAVIDVQECAADGTTCATVDATITCDADGAADDGTLTNGAIDAGDWVNIDIGTVTGTVGYVSITIKFTKDD